MPNAAVLTQLFPLDLSGALAADHAVSGAALDAAEAACSSLQEEIFPATTSQLLTRWEALLAITPAAADALQTRRDRVVARLRSRGSLTLSYFQALAASMGLTVTIHENIGGDPYKWGVELPGSLVYYFRAGESCCGEYLSEAKDVVPLLSSLFQDLKPAHTQCVLPYTP